MQQTVDKNGRFVRNFEYVRVWYPFSYVYLQKLQQAVDINGRFVRHFEYAQVSYPFSYGYLQKIASMTRVWKWK